MAGIPKGNFVALQPLKPVDYTNGQLFLQQVDGWVKQGQYEKAAAAKQAAEDKARADDFYKGLKVEPAQVAQPAQEASSRLLAFTMDGINQSKIKALNAPTEYERQKYFAEGQKLKTDYLTFNNLFNGEVQKSYLKFKELAGTGEYFEGDPRFNMLSSMEKGAYEMGVDEYGGATVSFFGNVNNENKDQIAPKYGANTFSQLLGTTPEKNLVPKYQKELKEAGQSITNKIVDNNGRREIANVLFDPKKAKQNLYTRFGFDANTSDEANFDPNNIPKELSQYFWEKNGHKTLTTVDDFKTAIQQSIDYMKSNTDTSTSYKVLETAEDRELQRWQIANAKKQFYKKDNQSGGSATAQNMNTPSEGEYRVQVKDAKGNVVGFKSEITSVLPIASNQFVGLSNSKDKKGNYYNSYKIGEKGGNGEIIFGAPINQSQFENYIRSQKKNPIVVLGQLKSNVSAVNVWNPNLYQKVAPSEIKANPYTSIKIGSGSNNDYQSESSGMIVFPK